MKTSWSRSPRKRRTPCWTFAARSATFLSDASNELDLRDVAYTAGARRGHHDHRLALVVSSRDDAIEALDTFRRGEPHWSIVQGEGRGLAAQELSSSFPAQAASGGAPAARCTTASPPSEPRSSGATLSWRVISVGHRQPS